MPYPSDIDPDDEIFRLIDEEVERQVTENSLKFACFARTRKLQGSI